MKQFLLAVSLAFTSLAAFAQAPDENRFVKLKLSARGLRVIDKKGIDVVLAEIRGRGEKV